MIIWPIFLFVICFGACAGSFINVVIIRMPRGISVIWPASHDPATGAKLKWWENIPIVSYLALRGRSRYTGERIPIQYLLMEVATAALFAGLYLLFYVSDLRDDWARWTVFQTWPLLITYCLLVACLLAATVIDARLFIIPLPIPWFATACALVIMPLAAHFYWGAWEVAPRVTNQWLFAGIGGGIGLGIALVFLKLGVLPQSFAVVEQDSSQEPGEEEGAGDNSQETAGQVAREHEGENGTTTRADVPEELDFGSPEEWLAHPHPRREVLKECLFLLLPNVGMITAYQMNVLDDIRLPRAATTFGGVLIGYLGGCGLVWGIRIFGTLLFGKEAMGLGDVHLLGAIGAVMGVVESGLVFFIAPFMGLLGAVVFMFIAKVYKAEQRSIPYGPYLAAGALVVMVLHRPLMDAFGDSVVQILGLWPVRGF